MTVSFWQREPSPASLRADLVVVGGGVCGLSAALHASRRGLSVLVLERGRVGSGASTRNAGFLMRGMAENYATARELLGADAARLVWHWSEENLRGLLGEGVGALASYRPTPSCLLALEADEAEELATSAELLQADGFGVLVLEGGRDSVWSSGLPLAGLVNPGDATVNPAHLVELLRLRLGRRVVEGQEVYAIADAAGGGCEVRTGSLRVACGRVLVCTNAYAPLLLPELGELVRPRRGQMLALDGAGLTLDYAYYANRGHEYLRQTPTGEVVVGGCRQRFSAAEVGLEDRTTAQVQEAIEAFARLVLDRPIRVRARWAGTMGFSTDGMPLIGPVRADGSVWFCGGFTGHGMSLGYRAAAAGVTAMLDGPDADTMASWCRLDRTRLDASAAG